MGVFVTFHRPPVIGEAIVTDILQLLKSKAVILYYEATALENGDLVRQVDGGLGVLVHDHNKAKDPPAYACAYGRVSFKLFRKRSLCLIAKSRESGRIRDGYL